MFIDIPVKRVIIWNYLGVNSSKVDEPKCFTCTTELSVSIKKNIVVTLAGKQMK